jgi:integrase
MDGFESDVGIPSYSSHWWSEQHLRGAERFARTTAQHCANCAAAGIDSQVISNWMGHQTDEMVNRYRHLFPTLQRRATDLIFG